MMGWILVLVGLLTTACSSNNVAAPTGVPAKIVFTSTIIAGSPPPKAVIVATVHDAGGQPVPGIPVLFTTTSGFITSGGPADAGGNVQAFLTGAAGSSPTVTATTAGTPGVTGTTVVHF